MENIKCSDIHAEFFFKKYTEIIDYLNLNQIEPSIAASVGCTIFESICRSIILSSKVELDHEELMLQVMGRNSDGTKKEE